MWLIFDRRCSFASICSRPEQIRQQGPQHNKRRDVVIRVSREGVKFTVMRRARLRDQVPTTCCFLCNCTVWSVPYAVNKLSRTRSAQSLLDVISTCSGNHCVQLRRDDTARPTTDVCVKMITCTRSTRLESLCLILGSTGHSIRCPDGAKKPPMFSRPTVWQSYVVLDMSRYTHLDRPAPLRISSATLTTPWRDRHACSESNDCNDAGSE